MKSLRIARSLVASLVVAIAPIEPSIAQTRTGVDWADWQARGPDFMLGRVALGGGESADITFSGAIFNAFTDALPEPYWGPADTYRGTQLANQPPSSDMIFIGGGPGRMTLTFSQPVVDPVIAIASLGLTNSGRTIHLQTAMKFEQSFEILSNGANFYAGGQFLPFTRSGNDLFGIESSGVIRFRGTFSEIAWTSPLREENSFGELVGTYGFTVGSAGCDNYELGPNPLSSAGVVRAGCQAYTRGTFSQQAQLEVRGTLRAEGNYNVDNSLSVAPGGTVDHRFALTVSTAGQIELRGNMTGNTVIVNGTITTMPGSSWITNGLIVNSGAQVHVGGSASWAGSLSSNGLLQFNSGANVTVSSPLLIGGGDASIDVRAGSHVQALGGLFLNSNALATVSGNLTVQENLHLSVATLRIKAGGTLTSAGSGTLEGLLDNAGTFVMNGATVNANPGSTLFNAGLWRVGSGSTLTLNPGVTLNNTGRLDADAGLITLNDATLGNHGVLSVGGGGSVLLRADARIDNTGEMHIRIGGTIEIASDADNLRLLAGRLRIDHGGRLEMGSTRTLSTAGAAKIDNSGVIVLRSAAAIENGARVVVQTGGRIEVDNGARIVTGGVQFEIAPGAEIIGGGIFEQVAGVTTVNGTINLPFSIFNSGTLMGNGTVFGNSVLGSVVNGGSILFLRPGNSPGTITFAGDVRMENTIIEIEAGDFDRLDRVVVSGALELIQAETHFLVGADYRPDLNDSGTWLAANNAIGLQNITYRFDNLPDGWEARYEGGNIALWNPLAIPLQASAPGQTTAVHAGQIAYLEAPGFAVSSNLWIGGALAIRPGAILSAAHGFAVAESGRLTNRGELRVSQINLINAGTLENRRDGLLRNETYDMRNFGRLLNTGRIENAGYIFNEAGATFEQRGTLVNEASALLINLGHFSLSGTIQQAETARVLNQGGLFHVQTSGSIAGGGYVQSAHGLETRVDGLLDAQSLEITAGILSGGGRIGGPAYLFPDGIATNNGPLLRPGAEASDGHWGGKLTFAALASIGAGSIVEIILTGEGKHGLLVFEAGAAFDPGASLRLVLARGFTPGAQMTVPFIETNPAFDLMGFAEVVQYNTRVVVRGVSSDEDWSGGLWSVTYRTDGVDFQLAPVPEPRLYALFLIGLCFVAWAARRRTARPV